MHNTTPGFDSAAPWIRSKTAHRFSFLFRNFDLLAVLISILADIRLFQGSGSPSFTVFELIVIGYCLPSLLATLLLDGRAFEGPTTRVMQPLVVYAGWLMLASAAGLAMRGDANTLQQAKNVLPSLILIAWLFVRIRQADQIVVLLNTYVLWALLSAALGLVQLRGNGPYLRELVTGIEFKLDLAGNIVDNPVVGFTGHPNSFGLCLMPAVVLAGTQLVAEIRDRTGPRIRTIVILSVLIGILFVSQAKGAMLWAGIGFVLVHTPFGRLRGALPVFLVVTTAIAAIVAYGIYQSQSAAVSSLTTIETRFLLWSTALAAMTSDAYIPIFGDARGYMLEWSGTLAHWSFPEAHNGWIDQAVHFGIPALLAYIWLWAATLRAIGAARASREAAAVPLLRFLLDAVRASLVALMGVHFFEPTAVNVADVSQAALLIGLGVATAGIVARRAGLEVTARLPKRR